MSPSIDFSPDLLGMFKHQSSPLPTAVATDLEVLCSALDLLQASGQADLNALAGCLSRLSDWLKNQQEAAPDDVSGWTSEPFGVKGMGGMITCRSDQREVIFNMDGSGQPYLGMWHSRLPGEADRNGSFKIQASDGGTQLVLEGSRPLQVSLPALGTVAWGSMGAFLQELNSSNQPNQPEAAQLPPPPVQGLPVLPSPPNIPDVEVPSEATPTILSSRRVSSKLPAAPLPQPSGNALAAAAKPDKGSLYPWQCICGSKNTDPFCPKCGAKRPAVNAPAKSAPPAFCRQCGAALSEGSQFCRKCGAKIGS